MSSPYSVGISRTDEGHRPRDQSGAAADPQRKPSDTMKRINEMSLKTRVARRRGTFAAVAALGLGLAPTLAHAQAQPQGQAQPQQRPAPRQPPAAPAAPAPAPQAAPQAAPAQGGAGPTVVTVKPEPSQSEWVKVCGKDQGNGAEICYTTRDFVSDQGQPVLAVAVYDIKGGPGGQSSRIVRFLMPLGLLLQPGVRFAVDQGAATPGRYAICFPNGCFAEAPVKDDVINAMKKGTTINVSVQNQAAREVTFAVPAAGFGKAFDGPALDPKVLEDQQKKLQEELEKKSEEMRKKLEQSQGAAGAAPAAAAAPKP
jgi:invasion protein IalB